MMLLPNMCALKNPESRLRGITMDFGTSDVRTLKTIPESRLRGINMGVVFQTGDHRPPY